MKTLDEVIDYCEGKQTCGEWVGIADALHYLKEYREMLNTRIYIPEGYTREKTGFTHQDFANTFREEPHFIRDVMVGTSQNLCNTSQEDPDGDHQQLEKCRALQQDFYRNDPLSWDELKTMEGKPVWVEWTKSEESYWCFVGEWFDDDEMRIYRMGWDYADYIHKTIYTPDIVQAYRKENE